MVAVDEAVQHLRQRFILATSRKNVEILAYDVGVNSNTLYQFRAGEDVRLDTLRKIAAWCDAQEQKGGPHEF